MTILPAAWSRAMTPAFSPLAQFTVPKPGTETERAEGIASCMSMSYIAAGETDVLTVPVICHCHVVPGFGFQTPPVGGRGLRTIAHAPPSTTSVIASIATIGRRVDDAVVALLGCSLPCGVERIPHLLVIPPWARPARDPVEGEPE